MYYYIKLTYLNMTLCSYSSFVSSTQVRLAASVTARKFLLGLPSDEAREQFFAPLLPPLCLNRYYVAEGVRIYNQQTWKLVTQTKGRELVALHIRPVVSSLSYSDIDWFR